MSEQDVALAILTALCWVALGVALGMAFIIGWGRKIAAKWWGRGR